MSLIDDDIDWPAILAAEDAAIVAAQNPKEVPPIPLGLDLANLIESLSHGDPSSIHES